MIPASGNRWVLKAACAVVCLSHGSELQAQIPAAERQALIAIYEATNGPEWSCGRGKNWLGPEGSESEWSGVTVEGGHVTGLTITGSGAVGPIPAEIADLAELRTLNLGIGYCGTWDFPFPTQITLPPELGSLAHLEELHLSRAGLEVLPETLGRLTRLRDLNLYFNPLRRLPDSFGNLASLETLNISFNRELEIPADSGLFRLPSLRRLYLIGTRTTLPESITGWRVLERLDLRETGLERLTSGVGNLGVLEILRLDDNQLVELPPEIGNLNRLQRLTLRNNLLESLPESIGGLSAVTELDLTVNRLVTLPAGIGGLSSLVSLSLASNRLESLPPEIGRLGKLDSFFAGSNNLARLPDEVADLRLLTRLSLASNRFTQFPRAIGDLPYLKFVSFYDNQVEGPLPEWLTGIKHLTSLGVSGNRLQGEVPANLMGAPLAPGALGLQWNALHTSRDDVRDFINTATLAEFEFRNQPFFGATQTVPPADIEVGRITGSTVELSWTPIEFSDFGGRYEVFAGRSQDLPPQRVAQTPDKKAESIVVSDLDPGATYFFYIRTVSDPHPRNANRVFSRFSDFVTATTAPFASTFVPALNVDDGFVGVAVSNPDAGPTRLRFRAFNEAGEPAGAGGEAVLVPGGQLARLTSETNPGAAASGWLEILADRIGLGHLFQIGGAGRLDGGLAFSRPLPKRFYFSRARDRQTFGDREASFVLTVANPNPDPIDLELLLTTDRRVAPVGFRSYKVLTQLPPFGSLRRGVAELFGASDFGEGHIRVDVVSGRGAFGFLTAELESPAALVGLQAIEPASGPFYSAQLATGGGLFTSLKLINVSGEIRNLTIGALDEKGNLLAPTRTVELVPLFSSFQTFDVGRLLSLGPQLVVGSLRIETDGDGILGDVLFGRDDLGFAAALPLQQQPFTRAVFSQIASTADFFTGVAVLNPNAQPATVSLEVFADTGARLGGLTLEVPARARFSRLLRELVETPGFTRGYVVLRSDVPVVAQQLFGDFDQTVLSAVPPTVLPD